MSIKLKINLFFNKRYISYKILHGGVGRGMAAKKKKKKGPGGFTI